jgi:hypothetical protein
LVGQKTYKYFFVVHGFDGAPTFVGYELVCHEICGTWNSIYGMETMGEKFHPM